MRVAGGLIILTLISAIPMTFWMPPDLLALVSGTVLLGGGSASAALFIGRSRSTTGVMAGMALGTFVKIATLGAAALEAWWTAAPVIPALLYSMALLLLYSGWTSWCFHVASSADLKTYGSE